MEGFYTVISDVHHASAHLDRIMPVINSSRCLFFCGDGLSSMMNARGEILIPHILVRGNCDFYTDIDESACVTIDNVRALITHGHRQSAKQGFGGLVAAAKRNDCSLVLFGHTHVFCDKTIDGVRLINPGALLDGSYATLRLSNGMIVCTHRYV